MPQDFVVLSTLRCGSYHLTSLLDSAPDLACLGEIYKPGKVELPRELLRGLGLRMRDVEARDAMGADFLARLAAASPGRGFGFKLFPFHVTKGPAFLREELFSGRRRVVALTRPALEIAVSLAVGRANGALTQKADTAAAQAPVPVAARQIEAGAQYRARLDAMRNRLAAADGVEVFDITYAQLADPGRLDALLGFLGSTARAEELSSDYRKQGRGALHERVTNWPEVVALLRQTGRGALLAASGYTAEGRPAA